MDDTRAHHSFLRWHDVAHCSYAGTEAQSDLIFEPREIPNQCLLHKLSRDSNLDPLSGSKAHAFNIPTFLRKDTNLLGVQETPRLLWQLVTVLMETRGTKQGAKRADHVDTDQGTPDGGSTARVVAIVGGLCCGASWAWTRWEHEWPQQQHTQVGSHDLDEHVTIQASDLAGTGKRGLRGKTSHGLETG